MAYVDYEGNGGSYSSSDPSQPDNRPPSVWTDPGAVVTPPYTPASQGVTDPTTRAGSAPDPNSPAELARLNAIYGPGGTVYDKPSSTSTWNPQQETYNAPASSGFDSGSWIASQLASAQSTDDPAYWKNHIDSDPNVQNPATRDSALAYWAGRIAQGDGALGVRNGSVQKFQDGGGGGASAYASSPGGNPGSYTDPSSMLYLQQVLKRLQQVQQPQDNSILDLLKSLAMTQVQKLQQKPYSAADDQALITQYREPLNQARDTAKQQAALDLSRRGIGPTSGVYQDRMKQIDQAYVKGVAQGSNQMGVNAVQQQNTNALQALQILSGLQSATNTQTDRSNAMSDQAVNLAKMFPDFDATRLDQLLRASGDTSGSSSAPEQPRRAGESEPECGRDELRERPGHCGSVGQVLRDLVSRDVQVCDDVMENAPEILIASLLTALKVDDDARVRECVGWLLIDVHEPSAWTSALDAIQAQVFGPVPTDRRALAEFLLFRLLRFVTADNQPAMQSLAALFAMNLPADDLGLPSRFGRLELLLKPCDSTLH